MCDRSAVIYFAPLDVLLIAKEEGSSATDSLSEDETDVRKKEEGRRKKEEGRRKKEEVTGNCAK
ncbi:hypothetical protein NDI43_10935 [Microcoleus vaginatus GB2-A3]|uniref:hypothetical protein n=1 Tax=Microcoleus vaginatus TaxID=119532 RepID=UPI0032A8C3A8